jgi:hypothetical protein
VEKEIKKQTKGEGERGGKRKESKTNVGKKKKKGKGRDITHLLIRLRYFQGIKFSD